MATPLVSNRSSPARKFVFLTSRVGATSPSMWPTTTGASTRGVTSVCPPQTVTSSAEQARSMSVMIDSTSADDVPSGSSRTARNQRGRAPSTATSFALTCTAYQPTRSVANVIGSVAGPHPYPAMVRDFQAVIGHETRAQMSEKQGRLPDSLVACIGGGSNAMGLFHPFLNDADVKMIGVEAGGKGVNSGLHAASLNGGTPGVLHGNRTYLLQNEDGQIIDAHSISAGLDYPGIGPEHAWLHEQGRVEYVSATDDEALEAFQICCRQEGIIPALETAHALAEVAKRAPTLPREHLMVVNLSGRGDKDMMSVAHHLGDKFGVKNV